MVWRSLTQSTGARDRRADRRPPTGLPSTAGMAAEAARAVGWVSTGLLAFQFLLGGLMTVARVPAAVAGTQHLGSPLYFGLILRTWKILGALAIVAPRTPRLKEWAYAGIVFDLTGAFVSLAASGDGVPLQTA